MKKRVLIVLLAALVTQTASIWAQSQKAEVVSSGGGKSQNENYQNFGVVGEPVVNRLPANENYQDRQGFINKLGPDQCPITLFPTNYDFNSAVQENQILLITIGGPEGGDCFWMASSDQPWVIITSATTGMGTGTITYRVLRNDTGNPAGRTAHITVTTGDPNPLHSPKVFTIWQSNSLAVPTLPEWGMIILGVGLLLGSAVYLRKTGLI